MPLKQFKSPGGSPIIGTLETVPGVALIAGFDPDTGEAEHEGETMMFWNDQATVKRGGKVVFVDAAHEEWTRDQLIEIPEAGQEAER